MTDRPQPGPPPPYGNYPGQPNQLYGQQPGYSGGSAPHQQQWPPATALGQHGAASPDPTLSAPKPNRTGLYAGLGVIGLLVIVLVVVLVLRFGGGGGGGGPIRLTPAQQAQQAALDYYTAISEGRAADARALLYSTDNGELLTDEVLADSLTRAPLTEIVVGDPVPGSGPDAFDVPVSYNLAGAPVTDELYISTYKDEPRIYTDPAYISHDEALNILVNGTAVTSEYPRLFPGSYIVSVDSEFLTFQNDMLVVTNSEDYKSQYDMKLIVNEQGVALFREKVIAEAQACLASMALDPGCGAALPGSLSDGTPIRDGSVIRTQDAEARAQLQSITPTPGSSATLVISVYGSDLGGIDIKAECQSGGGWAPCDLRGYGPGFSFGSPSINLADPNLAVEWD